MTWLESIGKPLRPSREEAVEYITTELTRAAPAGWRVESRSESRPGSAPGMSWRVARTQIPEGEWPTQEYDVHLSAGLDFVIFTHGNRDVGPMTLSQLLQHATVAEAWVVNRHGMGPCLEHVMSTCKPNEWGYS